MLRNCFLLLIISVLLTRRGAAQPASQLIARPPLIHAVVYLNGTMLEHQGQLTLAPGLNRVVVARLSSLRAAEKQEVIIGAGVELQHVDGRQDPSADEEPTDQLQGTRYERTEPVALPDQGRRELVIPAVRPASQPNYLAIPRVPEAAVLQAIATGWQGLQQVRSASCVPIPPEVDKALQKHFPTGSVDSCDTYSVEREERKYDVYEFYFRDKGKEQKASFNGTGKLLSFVTRVVLDTLPRRVRRTLAEYSRGQQSHVGGAYQKYELAHCYADVDAEDRTVMYHFVFNVVGKSGRAFVWGLEVDERGRVPNPKFR